ncbi:MAG: HNH endonuclease [Burkholderiales bacterium]
MRPVNSITQGAVLLDHRDAKPDLVAVMGEFCCYCERALEARDLHVEHIKPQIGHPKVALTWGNFLLACTTCNTYKRHYQGSGKQIGILSKQAWPHLDNTFLLFDYDKHGRMRVASSIANTAYTAMADSTLQMAGLSRTPAVSATYEQLGLDYDSTSRRAKAWRKANTALNAFLQNPTDIQIQSIADQAEEVGFFSIWMRVFDSHAAVKRKLVQVFKASSVCFDANASAVSPRQPGRI